MSVESSETGIPDLFNEGIRTFQNVGSNNDKKGLSSTDSNDSANGSHDIHSFKGMDSSDLSEIAKTVCEKLDQYKVAVYTDPGSSKEGPALLF